MNDGKNKKREIKVRKKPKYTKNPNNFKAIILYNEGADETQLLPYGPNV